MHNFAENTAYMLQSCGQRAHKARVAVGEVMQRVHSRLGNRPGYVHNRAENTPTFTHLGTFLCTTYEQVQTSFSSVIQSLVHIVHRAYKYQSNSKEGTY